MLVQSAVFTNLFFVPTLSIYLYYRKSKKALIPSLDLLFQYCMAVCFNFGLTKLLLFVPQYILGYTFTMDSARYTVVALCSAWLLYKLQLLMKYIKMELHNYQSRQTRRTQKAEIFKAVPYIIAIAHWQISFYTDDFIFVRNGISLRYVVLKAVYLFVLAQVWRLLFFVIQEVLNKNLRIIKAVQFFLLYFCLFTVIMLCIWPGNWVWDDIWMFVEVVTLDFGNFAPWQHVLTAFVYIISLMILPFPAGIVIVQYTFIAGVIGFILGNYYVGLRNKKYIIPLSLPFFMFPVLAMVFYPMRLIPYAFLELLFFFIVTNSKRTQITKGQILPLVFLNAMLAVWRGEGIIFLVLGPALFGVFQKDKRARIKYIVAVAALVLVGTMLQNHYIGDNKEYYELTAYMESLDDLAKYEYQVYPESPIIQELGESVDIAAILSRKTGGHAFWDEPRAYANLLETHQYDVVKKNFVKLVLKHPVVFIKERIYTFLTTSALTSDSGVFINYQLPAEFVTDYPFTKSIDENLRVNTLSLLAGRKFDLTGVRADFRFWYNLFPPLLLLLFSLTIEIKKRCVLKAACLLCLCIQTGIVFLAAPATLFMYYFPIYLSGYFWGVYEFVEKCDEKYRLKNQDGGN